MKKAALFLLLVPALAFAGGSHHETTPHKTNPQPTVPTTPTPTPQTAPPVVVPTPAPAPVPSVAPQSPTGGGGMIYCSGPLAPGWHVDQPNGGCKATVIYLRDVPYTGGQGLSYGQLTGLFLAFVAGLYVLSRIFLFK